ncbi:MAG: hypothetical protein ABI723_27030 [Bacteroidia bacterium]
MKKNLLLLLFLSASLITSSQSFEMGVAGGFTNYFGDLGNNEFFQSTSTRPGMAVTLRHFLGAPKLSGYAFRKFDVEARFSWHRLGYDETQPFDGRQGYQLRNYYRGLSFRTDVFSVEGRVTYTIYKNRRQPMHIQKSCMYFFTGLGFFYGKPKADLFRGSIDINNRYYFWSDGTVRDAAESTGKGNEIKKDGKYETNLNDWPSEGSGMKHELGKNSTMCNNYLGVPVGFGFRYGLNKKVNMSFEIAYYKLFTDCIDNVSNRYAYKSEIQEDFPNDPMKQELAAYIADPTGKGTDGYPGPQTSPRGNPGKSDSYTFISLEFSYKFDFISKKLFGMR